LNSTIAGGVTSVQVPEWSVSRATLCPQCDSPNVRPMAARAHEAESAVAWIECLECGRMWNIRKQVDEDPSA
jgi:RNase P subunit RPR2